MLEPSEEPNSAVASRDAFDALVAALWLAEHLPRGACRGDAAPVEGAIWLPPALAVGPPASGRP